MWCPVAVRHFCKAIRSRPQEAKTGKGLMNIFLDTVRHATLVDKDDRHRDHQELKAIWSSIVGFERRLCLCMTDTLRRWAVWWEGQAQGQRTRQPPATDSRKNLQTLACWAARQTRACKFLREGQGGVLPNPSIASPTQLSDQESWKYAVDSGSQTHVGIAPLGQRLGILHNRDDVGSLVAGKERGGASSPDARQKRARADDGLVCESIQPFCDMIAAFPATWHVTGSRDMRQAMKKQVFAFGFEHSWSMLASGYIRSHVIRKLVLLAARVCKIDDETWARCNQADFESLAAPKNWRAMHFKLFKWMAPEVPMYMHSIWTGLAKCATTATANGQEAFIDAVVAFIEAACEQATQDAARTVFEGARCRLAELRGGMQPTPLMIFRELERTGSLDVGGAPSPARQAAIARAAATAAVASEEVAATPSTKLRRRISSKSPSSASVSRY